MNVGELLALGTRARQTLQVKLVAEGVFPQPDGTFFEGAMSRGGRLSDKAPQSFKAFYQAAEILKSEEFIALSEEFEPVADTPKRIKQLDKYRQQLGYSPIQYAIAEDMFEQQQQPDQETDTSSPVTEAEFVPQAQLGQQVQGGFGRAIPTQFSGGAATIETVGTKENPYDTPRTAAEFDRIPIGGLFIGRNGEIRTKRKERNK